MYNRAAGRREKPERGGMKLWHYRKNRSGTQRMGETPVFLMATNGPEGPQNSPTNQTERFWQALRIKKEGIHQMG